MRTVGVENPGKRTDAPSALQAVSLPVPVPAPVETDYELSAQYADEWACVYVDHDDIEKEIP